MEYQLNCIINGSNRGCPFPIQSAQLQLGTFFQDWPAFRQADCWDGFSDINLILIFAFYTLIKAKVSWDEILSSIKILALNCSRIFMSK